MKHKYTLEERKSNYEKLRKRIFNEAMECRRPISNRILKLRKKFGEKKQTMKLIIEAIRTADCKTDPRAFAVIQIENTEITGLLDTGASVSLLGKNCREIIEKLGISFKPIFSVVSTAGGKDHRLLGKCKLEVKFKDKIRDIVFYLCPDLQQVAYLVVDFWKVFQLAPDIFPLDELNVQNIQEQFRVENHKSDPHELSVEQKR